MYDPINLPIVAIDPTFPNVIQDVHAGTIPTETFWISCYKASETSVHARIQAELHEINRDSVLLRTTEGDLNISRSDDKYLVSCTSLGIDPTHVLPPLQEYSDLERSNPQNPQRITAFDISPDSTRFATGFLDGSVFLYPVSQAPPEPSASPSNSPIHPAQTIKTPIPARATARPHLSTTTTLRFFPSSKVLLSSGADFSLSILPADLPTSTTPTSTSLRLTPARTLRAHTRPITATIILGPGRNILSASLDGTLKLWDVPSSTPLASLPTALTQPILSATLGPGASSPAYPQPSAETAEGPTDEREVPEAHANTVFCGLQDGSVELFDLRSKRSVFRSSKTPRGGIATVAHLTEQHLLATGSSRGTVSVYDTRALSIRPVTSFTRSQGGAGVEDLAFVDGIWEGVEAGLVVATTDGLPYVAGVDPDNPRVMVELAGGDCDPVRCVRTRAVEGNQHRKRWDIWAAGDDAIVRRWRV